MAQDYAGLLTGLDTRPPNPMAGMDREGRMAYRAQGFADTMGRGLVTSLGMDARTDQERTRDTIGSLKLNTTDKLQQERNVKIVREVDPVRAQKLAQMYEAQNLAADEKKLGMDTQLTQRTQFATYLERTYPELDLRGLVEAGTLTPQNLKDFLPALQDKEERYLPSGGSVFDTQTREWIAGPAAKGNPKDDILTVSDRLFSISKNDFITDAPTDESRKTEEMVTWEYIKSANDAKGIETPDFSTWRTDEADYSNRSPQRKVYDDLSRAAVGTDKKMPTYNDWFEAQKKADTTVVKTTNADTGVETSYLINSGTGDRIANLGITGMPTLSIQKNDDGTYQLFNSLTGSLGEPTETAASAAIKQKKFYKTYSAIQELDATMGILGEAKGLREGQTAVGYVLSKSIAGTDARELASKVDTIQANLAFDELEKMRKNSPTGGALGQVTEMELRLLKSAVSGLDPALGVEAFNDQVELIKQSYDRFKLALIGEGDYRVVDGEYFIKAPDGAIYNVGTVGGEL